MAFIALVACELDINDPATAPLLEPLARVLDKAWLLPMHASRIIS